MSSQGLCLVWEWWSNMPHLSLTPITNYAINLGASVTVIMIYRPNFFDEIWIEFFLPANLSLFLFIILAFDDKCFLPHLR